MSHFEIERDYCSVCHLQFDTCASDGTIRRHGARGAPCPGSRQLGQGGLIRERETLTLLKVDQPTPVLRKARNIRVGDSIVAPSGTHQVRSIHPFDGGKLLFCVGSPTTALTLHPNAVANVVLRTERVKVGA